MSKPDLRAYEYFRAVARLGSVRAAAEACAVTQPAISKQLAVLEDSVGVVLFVRHRSGMTLTPAGAALDAEVRQLLRQAERTARVTEFWRGFGPSIRVACLDTTLHFIMAPFVAETGAAIADLRPERAADVFRTLDDEIDLAIGTALPPRGKNVEVVGRVPVSVQFRDGVFRIDPPARIEHLAGVPIVISGKGSAVERVVRRAAQRIEVDLSIAHVVSSGRMAQAAAASRDVVAITTEPAQFGLRSVAVTAAGKPLAVTLSAAWDRGHPSHRLIESIVGSLASWLSVRQPWQHPGDTNASTADVSAGSHHAR